MKKIKQMWLFYKLIISLVCCSILNLAKMDPIVEKARKLMIDLGLIGSNPDGSDALSCLILDDIDFAVSLIKNDQYMAARTIRYLYENVGLNNDVFLKIAEAMDYSVDIMRLWPFTRKLAPGEVFDYDLVKHIATLTPEAVNGTDPNRGILPYNLYLIDDSVKSDKHIENAIIHLTDSGLYVAAEWRKKHYKYSHPNPLFFLNQRVCHKLVTLAEIDILDKDIEENGIIPVAMGLWGTSRLYSIVLLEGEPLSVFREAAEFFNIAGPDGDGWDEEELMFLARICKTSAQELYDYGCSPIYIIHNDYLSRDEIVQIFISTGSLHEWLLKFENKEFTYNTLKLIIYIVDNKKRYVDLISPDLMDRIEKVFESENYIYLDSRDFDIDLDVVEEARPIIEAGIKAAIRERKEKEIAMTFALISLACCEDSDVFEFATVTD